MTLFCLIIQRFQIYLMFSSFFKVLNFPTQSHSEVTEYQRVVNPTKIQHLSNARVQCLSDVILTCVASWGVDKNVDSLI